MISNLQFALLLAAIGVAAGCQHGGAGRNATPVVSVDRGGQFTKSEFLRLDNFVDGISRIQSFPHTNVIGVTSWSTGCIVAPESGEVKTQFGLPKRNPTIIETKNGFQLLWTGEGFTEIRLTDLSGRVFWKYAGRFARATPIYSADVDVHYSIAHYTRGAGEPKRFSVWNSKFEKIYADQTISAGLTIAVRGDAALCQLAQEGTREQRLILRTVGGEILKEIPLKGHYGGVVAHGWPKNGSTVTHSKRKLIVLDSTGEEVKTVEVIPWSGSIIMDTEAVILEGRGHDYLAVLLMHKAGVEFSTIVILDEALRIVHEEKIARSWGMAGYREDGRNTGLLVPAGGPGIDRIQLAE